ncbi:MAG: DUF86 domain-containing protein, partial [Deltaproteobacteria bacterium]
MVRPDKVEGVLSNLKRYVDKLSQLRTFTREEFLADFTKIESAKHLFQISVECCLDISNHIIASEGFRAPKSYVESFEILSEQGIIPQSFFATLRQMAQFRNRLVHLYWEVDAEIVYEILQKNLGDFDTF